MKTKNNNELTRQRFRECIYQALAAEDNSKDQCAEFTKHFDILTDTGMSGEGAAGIIYSAYGKFDARSMLDKVSRYIHDNLENFNATSPGIDQNPANRWKGLAARYNKMIDSIKISYNNGLELSPAEIEKIKISLPSWINPAATYSSTASNLSLEVK
jgi:hypothetical protein